LGALFFCYSRLFCTFLFSPSPLVMCDSFTVSLKSQKIGTGHLKLCPVTPRSLFPAPPCSLANGVFVPLRFYSPAPSTEPIPLLLPYTFQDALRSLTGLPLSPSPTIATPRVLPPLLSLFVRCHKRFSFATCFFLSYYGASKGGVCGPRIWRWSPLGKFIPFGIPSD